MVRVDRQERRVVVLVRRQRKNKICLMIWLYYLFETAIAVGTLPCLALTAQAVRRTAKLMQEMRDLRVAQTQAQKWWTSQQSQYA
mgnify:CR=1 FL=1